MCQNLIQEHTWQEDTEQQHYLKMEALKHGKITTHPNGIMFYQANHGSSVHAALHEAFTYWSGLTSTPKPPFGFQISGAMPVPLYINDSYGSFGDRYQAISELGEGDLMRWAMFWAPEREKVQ